MSKNHTEIKSTKKAVLTEWGETSNRKVDVSTKAGNAAKAAWYRKEHGQRWATRVGANIDGLEYERLELKNSSQGTKTGTAAAPASGTAPAPTAAVGPRSETLQKIVNNPKTPEHTRRGAQKTLNARAAAATPAASGTAPAPATPASTAAATQAQTRATVAATTAQTARQRLVFDGPEGYGGIRSISGSPRRIAAFFADYGGPNKSGAGNVTQANTQIQNVTVNAYPPAAAPASGTATAAATTAATTAAATAATTATTTTATPTTTAVGPSSETLQKIVNNPKTPEHTRRGAQKTLNARAAAATPAASGTATSGTATSGTATSGTATSGTAPAPTKAGFLSGLRGGNWMMGAAGAILPATRAWQEGKRGNAMSALGYGILAAGAAANPVAAIAAGALSLARPEDTTDNRDYLANRGKKRDDNFLDTGTLIPITASFDMSSSKEVNVNLQNLFESENIISYQKASLRLKNSISKELLRENITIDQVISIAKFLEENKTQVSVGVYL